MNQGQVSGGVLKVVADLRHAATRPVTTVKEERRKLKDVKRKTIKKATQRRHNSEPGGGLAAVTLTDNHDRQTGRNQTDGCRGGQTLGHILTHLLPQACISNKASVCVWGVSMSSSGSLTLFLYPETIETLIRSRHVCQGFRVRLGRIQ